MPKRSAQELHDKIKELQRPPAEQLYAYELDVLQQRDKDIPKPPGWLLSPRAVLDFILGDAKGNIQPKFVGRRSFVECCIVALATNRGLMLIGEPGTAKSFLSELLAAAISGDSTLTIQGSAGTIEDQIRYSWNYALLLSEGPSERALVAAPLYRGMSEGKLVRFEELSRCPIEIQDSLLSVLSDRVLHIPELKSENNVLFARQGFNVIATSNTRDRGVNEMSAALKRRFNFETVQPIQDIREEFALVQRETDKMLKRAGVGITLPADKTEVLVTVFHELRNAQSCEGKSMEPINTVMSTAEAISVGYAAAMHAFYYGDGIVRAEHLVTNMLGSVLKDSTDDIKKLRHYFEHIVANRTGSHWKEFYAARRCIDGR
jgi:MoxR-like ATPase